MAVIQHNDYYDYNHSDEWNFAYGYNLSHIFTNVHDNSIKEKIQCKACGAWKSQDQDCKYCGV